MFLDNQHYIEEQAARNTNTVSDFKIKNMEQTNICRSVVWYAIISIHRNVAVQSQILFGISIFMET